MKPTEFIGYYRLDYLPNNTDKAAKDFMDMIGHGADGYLYVRDEKNGWVKIHPYHSGDAIDYNEQHTYYNKEDGIFDLDGDQKPDAVSAHIIPLRADMRNNSMVEVIVDKPDLIYNDPDWFVGDSIQNFGDESCKFHYSTVTHADVNGDGSKDIIFVDEVIDFGGGHPQSQKRIEPVRVNLRPVMSIEEHD